MTLKIIPISLLLWKKCSHTEKLYKGKQSYCNFLLTTLICVCYCPKCYPEMLKVLTITLNFYKEVSVQQISSSVLLIVTASSTLYFQCHIAIVEYVPLAVFGCWTGWELILPLWDSHFLTNLVYIYQSHLSIS